MNIEQYISKLEKDKVTIFLFHGVIKDNPFKIRNYNRKHIFENEFYELIKNLKNYGFPISMDDLIEGKELSLKPFIISFDDGFENNYSIAAPILDSLGVPAIFYITSSFVDKNLMSWIDQIDYALETTTRKFINLSFFKQSITISTHESKKDLLMKIRDLAKSNKNFFNQREVYITEIFNTCDVERITSLNSSIDLKMSWKQVSELNHNQLFTIGGHTHNHPIMSYLTLPELEYEINECLNCMQKKANITPIKHFSYPEGLEYCYNEQVIQSLKKYGILSCPTAIDGINGFKDNLFNLKRISVI